MEISTSAWIVVPLLGGVIGYVTNRIAVLMIFRPIRPVTVLGLRIQGLMGRRQPELAESIGRVVGGHLVGHEDVVRAFEKLDLEPVIGDLIAKGLQPKIDELRRMPLIGGFLTDERIADLRGAVAKSVMRNREILLTHVEWALEEGLDVHEVVRSKVAEFEIERLEALVLEVASRELRAIEILGGVLGLVIGVAQVFVFHLLG